jgi:phosphoribosylformimino-5-aminoimidazole carboxamide ribotide isomerase
LILYPAIDLKDGRCVRLLRGDMAAATVFDAAPADQARHFERAGFRWLHLVDLNGAFEGHPVNSEAVEAILAASDIPAQLGGGIRDAATIDYWLDHGVRRVILGTAAVSQPELVRAACKRHPGRIAVGIDARKGTVAVEGWAKSSTIRALDLALRFEDAGAAAIIYTDIDRDGALGGVNVEATADLAFALTTPVIASGGVASLHDLRLLKSVESTGIEGVIVGRALYDGRIDPATALALLQDERQAGSAG